MTSLQSLKIHSHSEHIDPLLSIASLSSLTELELNYCYLTLDEFNVLAKNHPQLHHLAIGGFRSIGHERSDWPHNTLFPIQTISYLKIRHMMSPCRVLLRSITKLPLLKSLHLAGCFTFDSLPGLHPCPLLEEVSLVITTIGSEYTIGLRQWCQWLLFSTNLQSICLSDTFIGVELPQIALLSALPLQKLRLSCCALGACSDKPFPDVPKSLKILDLSFNGINFTKWNDQLHLSHPTLSVWTLSEDVPEHLCTRCVHT